MNGTTDWGLPDWTKLEGYPMPRGPGEVTVWAWEFLRRNPEYRTFWLEKIQPFIGMDCRICRDAAGNWWPYHDELREKFGVDLPSHPQSATPAIFTATWTTWVDNDGEEFQRISLKEHQVAIVIDLARPLKTQFEWARKSAEREQKFRQQAGEIILKRARSRAENYVSYLRILDAREAGAKKKDIADLLFPRLTEECAQDRIDDDQGVARKLRDGGYRSLLELR